MSPSVNRNVVMGAIPMIVATIAAGADVHVVWGNYPTAATNGKVMYMPFLPLEDDKVEPYALGFAVHETGHVVGTEFGLSVGTGIKQALCNILEDVRIEGERMATLPGARHWLERLADVLLKDGKIGAAKEEWAVPEKLTSYLLTHLWVEILHFDGLRDAAARCRDLLSRALPPELFTQVEQKALSVKDAQSTRDVIALADSIVALLQQQQQDARQQAQQEEQQQEQQQAQGQDAQATGNQGQDGDDADSGAESGDGDADQSPGSDGQRGTDGNADSADASGGVQGNGDADEQSEGGDTKGSGSDSQSEDAKSSDGQGGDAGDQTQGDKTNGSGTADQSDGDESGDGQGGDAAGQSQASASGGDGGAVDGEGTASAGASSDPDGDDGPGGQPAQGQASNGMDALAVAQALQEVLDAQDIEEGKDISDRIAEGLGQVLQANAGSENAGNKPMGAPVVSELRTRVNSASLIGQVRLQSMALRAQLEEYVAAQTRRRSSLRRAGNRMARDGASRLLRGDYRIYRVERDEARKVDTAFVLLLDLSSSMDGTKLPVARQAAVALAAALEDIKGTQLSIIGFGGPQEEPVLRAMRFGEGLRATAGRLEGLRAGGTTPLAEALLVAHTDLLNLQAERRIVMVVTDGEPDNRGAVQQLVQFGRRHDIEHMGIGIQKTTDHLFPANCCIQQVAELPRAVLSMVQRVLFDNRLAA